MIRRGCLRIGNWANRPGRFYSTLCIACVISQATNLGLYLRRPHLLEALLPSSAQLFLLTAGALFLFRALQLLGSVAWMLVISDEPLPAPLQATDHSLPFVTVQIPLRNEELSVARLSIDSACALAYPKDRLEVLVMDNSDPDHPLDDLRQYVEAKGASFFHRTGVEGFKARNLNLLLPHTRGDSLLILDADSLVSPDVLLRALPLFEDPQLGFVQFRIDTINEETNLVARVGAMAARTKTRLSRLRNNQGFVTFEGHNGIMNRQALETVGGWPEEVSEDLALAIAMRMAGFRSKFLHGISSGEFAPERFPEMMKQRRKWSYGTGRLLWKNIRPILRSRLLWYEKLDLILFMATLAIDGFAFLTIFGYIPIPFRTVVISLGITFLPVFVAENFGLKRAFGRYIPFLAIMTALLPTLAYGTFLSIVGRNEPFPVTQKGAGRALSVYELLRLNWVGIVSACIFFALSCFVVGKLGIFVQFYLFGIIVMSSALVIPFVLNYME